MHKLQLSTIAFIAVASIVFGIAITAKDQLESVWLRALVAGIAIVGLVAAVMWIRRRAKA